jgi:hypothetical protein
LTEEESCGTPANILTAGTAFSEIPGKVHRSSNFGSTPAIMLWVETYPLCDPNSGTVVTDAPSCELQKIPQCPVPVLQKPRMNGGQLEVILSKTIPGQSYTIEQNTNLATTNWLRYTNFTATGVNFTPLFGGVIATGILSNFGKPPFVLRW